MITDTDSNVVDKNLYAYCDGNPVMRKDSDGDCWQIVAAIGGAVIGAGFEAGYEMIVEHKSFKQLNGVAIGGAALNGAVTAAFGPLAGSAGSAAITAITDLATSGKDLKKRPLSTLAKAGADAVVAAGLTYVCGNGYGASKRLASKVTERGIRAAGRAYRSGERALLKQKIAKKGIRHVLASRLGWGIYSTQKYYFYYSSKHYLWH